MNLNYYRRLGKLVRRDPRKLPAMLRLKTAKRKNVPPEPGKSIPPPLVIALRNSYHCNLRCVMCNQWGENGVFITSPERMVQREMSTQDFKDFFDQVSAFQPYIYFTGGEPLLSKDTLELVRYASSKHLITSMSTNSTLMKGREEEIVRSGLDYIYLSLDAPSSCGDAPIRISKRTNLDSTEEAVEPIKTLLRMRDELGIGLPMVQVQTIIVRENQDRLLEMAEYVDSVLKPDVWGIQLCIHTTPELNAETTSMYREYFDQDQVGWEGFIREFPEDMDFEGIQRQLDQILSRRWSFHLRPYRPIGLPGFNLKRYYLRPEEPSSDVPEMKCMNPYVFAQLQPNGDIAFCGSQPDYVAGNVKETPFKQIWNGAKAHSWREFLNNHSFPTCKRCFTAQEYRRFEA